MSTAFESILARAFVVLQAAAADIGATTVERRRVDARSLDELPTCEITRGPVESSRFSDQLLRCAVRFDVAFVVVEVAEAETELDAMHDKANAALLADAVLGTLCRDLHCVTTGEVEQIATGEGELARLTCTYQLQTLVRAANLASAL